MSVRATELWLTIVFLYHNLVQKCADVPVTPPCHLGAAVLKPHLANLGTCNHKTQTQTLIVTVTTAEMHRAYLWQQKRASSNQIASLLTTSPCLPLRPVWLSSSLSMMVVFFFKESKTCKKLSNLWFFCPTGNVWPFDLYPAIFQSVATLPPSGESLKILARDLGSRVYTKYSVRQKHQNQMLEKLSTIYNRYTEVLAKDTKVTNKELWSSVKCPLIPATSVILCYLHTYCMLTRLYYNM